MRRWTMALAVMAPLWALSWSPPAVASELKTIRVAKAVNDFGFMMADYAQQLGAFQRRGLTADIAVIVQSKMIQALIGGSVDFGLQGANALVLAAKGAPMKAIGTIDNSVEMLVIAVPRNSPLHTAADLRGRSVGVTSLGSMTDWAITQVATAAHIPPQEVRRVPLGGIPIQVAALRAGEIDAASIDITAGYSYEASGEGRILLDIADYAGTFYNHLMFASDSIIQRDPDAVRGFNAAIFETIAYVRTHRDQTVAFAAHDLGITPAIAARIYDQLIKSNMFSSDGQMSDAVIRQIGDDFLRLHILSQPTDLTAYVDRRFLPGPPQQDPH